MGRFDPGCSKEYNIDNSANFSKFALALIHEMRNPLTAISLSLHPLFRTIDPNSDEQESLRVIKRETERMEAMLKQFAEFSTPPEPLFRPLFLESLLMDLDQTWGHLVAARSLTLNIKSEFSPDSMMEGDEALLKRALGNLIENAAESLRLNGTISISMKPGVLQRDRQREDAIIIAIEDDGSGISPEVMEQVFRPFFSTRKMKVGLGLPIAERIAVLHRGQLAVRSEPNHGSIFAMTLPVHQTERF